VENGVLSENKCSFLDVTLSSVRTCAYINDTAESTLGFYVISPAGEEKLAIEAYCNFAAEETGKFHSE